MFRESILIGAAAILQRIFGLKWFLFPLNIFMLYVVTGGWKKIRILILTFKRDIRYLAVVLHVQRACRRNMRKTVPDIFSEICIQQPHRVALINADSGYQLTFAQMEKFANRVGNTFYKEGYRQGDSVALIMDSCPDYVCYWLGLAKIGVVTALINTSLRGESLAHCIKVSHCKGVIYGANFQDAVDSIHSLVNEDLVYFCADVHTADNGVKVLKSLLSGASDEMPPKPEGLNLKSKLVYIFTSGTTGLPKAAIMTNLRFYFSQLGIYTLFGLTPKDIVYIPLPIFHTTGCVAAIGQSLCSGLTVVIKNKFSASRLLDECIKYDCTVCFYIGEVCRYLLAQPPRPEDRMHKIRAMVGSGLKGSIWPELQERFRFPQISEFYGSTEGCGIGNTEGKVGSIGFMPNCVPERLSMRLVKIDEVTREVIRDKNGWAVECAVGEVGELISPISDTIGREFDGYVNKDASNKKRLYSAFRKGDVYFRSGDVFSMDELGYLYFMDRTGDTFRWKGENVSTAEVETLISKALGLKDVVGYGVSIPQVDGKAGMVCIADPEKLLDMEELGAKLKKILPPYSIPIFVRLSNDVTVTCTFKYQKVEIRKEGFDLGKVQPDDVFVYNSKLGRYSLMDKVLFNKIMAGGVRF